MNRIRPATTADVRELQCVHGVSNMRDMLALAPGNDPFYCDTPSGRRDGRWFADIWEQFGCKSGAHLRQIHYRILSERIRDVDGDVYENTEKCWHRLASASASARSLGMVLVESVGFQSITSAIQLLQRANGRPVRVFYVSDFDPAGQSMARAVARQVEFNIPRYAPDIDIRIEQIALTRQQVEEFDLPRIPIKESDRRRENFETENGAGAVELDALEALHPGSLAKIVREAAERYYDGTLHWRLNETAQETQSQWLGHADPKTTLIYAHLQPVDRDIEKFGAGTTRHSAG